PDLFVNMIMPLNDIRLNNNNNWPPFKSSILNPISDKSLIYRFHEYLNINWTSNSLIQHLMTIQQINMRDI
ncbi:hypothetical protein Q604_UNBc4C00129G0001, partial [human gut metagenome]